jgi:hypothetical protein
MKLNRQIGLVYLTLILFLQHHAALANISADEVDVLLVTDPTRHEKTSTELDQEANTTTNIFGGNNPEWNGADPNWQKIYTKIRADIEEENEPTIQYIRSSYLKEYKAVLAKNLDQTDAKTLLAYFSADEGKRYKAFNLQLEKVISDGLMASALLPNSPPNPSSEEFEPHYAAMVQQSSNVQISKEVADLSLSQKNIPNRTKAVNLQETWAIGYLRYNREKAEHLYSQYSADMEKFNTFTHSQEAQHLIHATALAQNATIQHLNDLETERASLHRQHFDNWRSMYLEEKGGK